MFRLSIELKSLVNSGSDSICSWLMLMSSFFSQLDVKIIVKNEIVIKNYRNFFFIFCYKLS